MSQGLPAAGAENTEGTAVEEFDMEGLLGFRAA